MDQKHKRLIKEIAECEKDKESGITVQAIDNNLSHLKGVFIGPEHTPYENGKFEGNFIPSLPFRPILISLNS